MSDDPKLKHTGETQRDEHAVIGGIAGKKVFVIDSVGNIVDFGSQSNLALQLDDVTTTSVTYIGVAAIGTATSAASWQIKKLDESGTPITLTIKWADGNDSFDNIWDNRSSLTYS